LYVERETVRRSRNVYTSSAIQITHTTSLAKKRFYVDLISLATIQCT